MRDQPAKAKHYSKRKNYRPIGRGRHFDMAVVESLARFSVNVVCHL
jgi:hypothetical protein